MAKRPSQFVERKELVDPQTGEEFAVPVFVGYRLQHKEPFALIYQEASTRLAKIAVERRLRPTALILAFHLLGRCAFENYLHLTQTQIATELGISKQQVSIAMRELLDIGIILRGPRIGGRTYAYRLNSAFAYKGRNLPWRRRKENQKVIDLCPRTSTSADAVE